MKAQKRSLISLVLLLMTLNVAPISAQRVATKKTTKAPAKLPLAAQSMDDQQAVAAVERLLGQSGQKYSAVGKGVWIIRRNGANLKYFQVVLSYTAGTLITEVIVVKRKSLRLEDAAMTLLRSANRLEYAKVCVDKDEDVFVRNEARVKSLDVDELTNNIDRIAGAADEVYAALQPFRSN